MTCEELMNCLEKLSPKELAQDWDNVGLLCGRRDKEVRRVLLALDAMDAVIDEAIASDADLLLTHHPLLFRPVKKINTDDFIGRRIVRLIQNDISYVAMHTNFDICGMADAAAKMLHLKDAEVLSVTATQGDEAQGIGRVGALEQAMTLKELALFVKEAFQVTDVRMYGDAAMRLTRVAVCPGSGKSVITDALHKQAQVLITGDIDHHEGIDAVAQGLAILDAGHYGIEKLFKEYMRDYLLSLNQGLTIQVARETNPYEII